MVMFVAEYRVDIDHNFICRDLCSYSVCVCVYVCAYIPMCYHLIIYGNCFMFNLFPF